MTAVVRQARRDGGGRCPPVDPAALLLTTAAAVAGVVLSGLAVVTPGLPAPAPRGTLVSSVRVGPQALPSQRAGRDLLARAALACHTEAFAGVESVGWQGWWPGRGTRRRSTVVVGLWHPRGGTALRDGLLGLSLPTVAVLSAHYRLDAGGYGQVAGRTSRVVTARRDDGTLAARFWLDTATGLPLRKQLFSPDGQVLLDASFGQVRLGHAATRPPAPGDRPWGKDIGRAVLARLRARGWPLPAPMPAGLVLLGAQEDPTDRGPVVGLDYTDGVAEVSVFLQRGHLPPVMAGWTRIALRGRDVYADEPAGDSVAWSARGFVYTVATTSSPQLLTQVVAALPHDTAAGFLSRVGDGLHRLLAWLSP